MVNIYIMEAFIYFCYYCSIWTIRYEDHKVAYNLMVRLIEDSIQTYTVIMSVLAKPGREWIELIRVRTLGWARVHVLQVWGGMTCAVIIIISLGRQFNMLALSSFTSLSDCWDSSPSLRMVTDFSFISNNISIHVQMPVVLAGFCSGVHAVFSCYLYCGNWAPKVTTCIVYL